MAEVIHLNRDNPEQDLDGARFLEHHLRENIYLNAGPHASYMLPQPYTYSEISTQTTDPNKLFPTAKYVLRGNLKTIEAVDKKLSEEGIDIFRLRGAVKIDEYNFICPPIIEVWDDMPMIVDGAHRLYIARQRGIEVTCVFISKVTYMLPMLPLSGWHEVHEHDTVPADKRNYAEIPKGWKHSELYRRTFHGSTGIRPILGRTVES